MAALIPPQLINRLGWSRGDFETVGTLGFEEGELLEVQVCKALGIPLAPDT